MSDGDKPSAALRTEPARAPVAERKSGTARAVLIVGAVLVLLLVGVGAMLAFSAIGARDAEIARLQDDNARLTADVTSARRERDDLSAQLTTARGDVTRLESEVTERQRRMVEAVAASEEALKRAGRDPHAVLALDDQLLREATAYIGYTTDMENALRTGDLTAIPAALMQLQAARGRWDSLVAQRNQAVADFLK